MATPDDDIRALAALDPALHAEVPASLSERVAGIPSGVTPVTVTPRPLRRWLIPAAAASLVLALGGGYLAGASNGFSVVASPATTPGGDPVAVTVGTPDDPSRAISLGSAGSDQAGAAQLTAGTTAQDTRALSVSPWHYANNRRFALPAFEAGPATGEVYALDGRAQYSAADATRIAAVLGMEGVATQDPENPYGWHIGDWLDWKTPLLAIQPTGGGDVQYRSGVAGPWMACTDEISPRYQLGDTTPQEVYEAYSAEVTLCISDTPMPTEEQARAALSLFLSATGVDETATEITLTPDEEGRTIWASAERVVGGNATSVTSSVTVSAAGFLSGYGPTASIVSLGEYDIVSPAEAAARLNDPVFAPAYASEAASEVDYESMATGRTEPPAIPDAGAGVPWGITEFEISSARLGLALMTSPDDVRFLAPAYEFTDTDGNVWSVLAVAENEIDPTGGGAQDGGWGYWR